MPQDIDFFFSVDQKASLEIPKIKGSRFIGLIYPAKTLQEIKSAISDSKNDYPDASHHCYAYRLQGAEIVQHQSDDGEPSGTAGAPIMRQIESADLRNVVLIVVRYFGGSKLGKAGLIKSYGLSAKELIAVTSLVKKFIHAFVRIRFAYTDTNTVNKVISKFDVGIVDKSFDQQTKLTLAVPKKQKDQFIEVLNNSLSGKLHWENITEGASGDLSL